jgi:hypothetical protein
MSCHFVGAFTIHIQYVQDLNKIVYWAHEHEPGAAQSDAIGEREQARSAPLGHTRRPKAQQRG